MNGCSYVPGDLSGSMQSRPVWFDAVHLCRCPPCYHACRITLNLQGWHLGTENCATRSTCRVRPHETSRLLPFRPSTHTNPARLTAPVEWNSMHVLDSYGGRVGIGLAWHGLHGNSSASD